MNLSNYSTSPTNGMPFWSYIRIVETYVGIWILKTEFHFLESLFLYFQRCFSVFRLELRRENGVLLIMNVWLTSSGRMIKIQKIWRIMKDSSNSGKLKLMTCRECVSYCLEGEVEERERCSCWRYCGRCELGKHQLNLWLESDVQPVQL